LARSGARDDDASLSVRRTGVPAVTMSAFQGDVPVTFDQILEVLGARGRSAMWRISKLEVAPSGPADRLHAASDLDSALCGDELFALAAGTQVIDGEFEASRGEGTEPWVLLRAVDGTSWDVVSDDLGVLRDYERSFPDTTRS
jgi:hypothetical protein